MEFHMRRLMQKAQKAKVVESVDEILQNRTWNTVCRIVATVEQAIRRIL